MPIPLTVAESNLIANSGEVAEQNIRIPKVDANSDRRTSRSSS
jgi:hypothetical protein